MDQYKLKKVMKLTQRWIQDNSYKNQAEAMKHSDWLQILTVLHKWKPDKFWTYEIKFLMTNDTGELTDFGSRSMDMCQTTYMFTYADTCSTKSVIDLADYGR